MYTGTLSVFDELDRMRRSLEPSLHEGRGSRWNLPFSRFSFLPGRSARAYPLVNVNESDDAYTLDALAPGLDPRTLKISATSNQVSIEGEKPAANREVENERCHRVERSGGTFRRVMHLATEIDRDGVRASYDNGILTIVLPKSEDSKPRTIEIGVA